MLKTLYARLVLWLIQPALSEWGRKEFEASQALGGACRIQVQTNPTPYQADLSLLSER